MSSSEKFPSVEPDGVKHESEDVEAHKLAMSDEPDGRFENGEENDVEAHVKRGGGFSPRLS